VTEDTWPVAELGQLARLRVLAAGLPGVWLEERTLAAPLNHVWGFVSDLERATPAYDEDVASIRIRRRDGDRLRVVARATWRGAFLPAVFDVELRPGWCWMVSRPRLYLIGMAAEPDGGRTRFGLLEGVVGDRRLLRPVLAASRIRHRRHVRHDVDGIERALGLERS
jgi:hypothetical protein